MDKLIYYKKMTEKFTLRNVGDIYYLSQIGESEKKCIIKANESTAYLWKLLSEFHGDAAIKKFCTDYNITEEKANAEINRFLKELEKIIKREP